MQKLKSISLFGKRYKNVTFENSETGLNPSFDMAFNRAKKYCENTEIVLKNGYGIYLFGDKGTGKTHLTACIANSLISKGKPVLFTNLIRISQLVKSTFNKSSSTTEQEIMGRFQNVDFLFFDDLGTEIFTKGQNDTWLQCLLFDLIDNRYTNQKSTIFSSNYTLNELINQRGIMEKTVDRICEMTKGAVMKFEGESRRIAVKSKEIPF